MDVACRGQPDYSPEPAPRLLLGNDKPCVIGYWYSLTIGEAIERIQQQYREDRISIEAMETMIEVALQGSDPFTRAPPKASQRPPVGGLASLPPRRTGGVPP